MCIHVVGSGGMSAIAGAISCVAAKGIHQRGPQSIPTHMPTLVCLASLLLAAFVPRPRASPRCAAPCCSQDELSPSASAALLDADNFILDENAVVQLVEAAFVPAVMGVSRGDVTELKLFIAAAQSGLNLGCKVDALGEQMRALPVQSAGRPLAPEEDDLRALWLALVYMTLSSRSRSDGAAAELEDALVPAALSEQHRAFVDNLIEAKSEARPLSQLSIDEMAGGGSRTAMEVAVLQQSTRIVYTTLDVLSDIELAGERTDAPRPFIPGVEGQEGVAP